MNNSDKKRVYLFALFITLVSTIFYLGILFIDGPVWCVDSDSYVTMNFTREPVYPIFLFILRKIFGTGIGGYDMPLYLFVAAFIQSLLWIYTTVIVTLYIFSIYRRNYPCKKRYTATFMALGVMVFQFSSSLIDHYFANRKSMYSECILTESLAIPLFILFCFRLHLWYMNHKKRDIILLCIIGFTIISTRKQMLVVLVLWFTISVLFDLILKSSRSVKQFIMTVCIIAALFCLSRLFDMSYNYYMRGVFTEHTGNNQGALCTLIYSSDEEDIELFNENNKFDGEKELFAEIYNQCAEGGLLKNAFTVGNWADLTEHYSNSYDIIGYDILMPLCYAYIEENYPDLDDIHQQMLENELEGDLASHLFHQNKLDLIEVFLANLLRAFVYSNTGMHPDILIPISFILYIIYIVYFIMNIKLCRKIKQMTATMSFSIVIIVGLCINAALVALLIFPQGRYMEYATGLFYTSFLLLFSRVTA